MPNQIQMSPTLDEIWRGMQREFKQKQKGWQAQTPFPLISALISKMEQKKTTKSVCNSSVNPYLFYFDHCTNIEDWAKK